MNFKSWFCNHDDNIIDKVEIPSQYDIIVKSGNRPNTYNSQIRKYIIFFKCSKCNRIKTLTTKTAQ